jgi:predicted acylesterase/phospholipase RssA
MQGPEKSCDLVMRGGTTSGVVYPLAVVELSKEYRFHNIGGTSAGALAAVVTAAAEYGRDSGGFAKIAELPKELATGLLDKFQPDPQLRPLFRLLLAAISGSRPRLVSTLLRQYWLGALLGALPGITTIVCACLSAGAPILILVLALIGLALVLIGATFGAAIAALLHARRGLPTADYGLCSGLTQPGSNGPALIDWLADMIDRVAGLPAGAPPLGSADVAAKEIVVKTVTTDLTTRRPYSLPIENNLHFFSEAEFRRLFPKRVVDFMIANSSKVETEEVQVAAAPKDLYYFQLENVPLVVLARLSLSFPGLVSCVPLWRIDYTLRNPGPKGKVVRCLFSDGGLSSNFPVHFFDAFLPQRPTFGISLGQYDDRRGRRVHLPSEAGSGRLLPTREFAGVASFIMTLIDAAKDWQDSLQSILPGYRERIVTVNLRDDEGGINLAMPPELIKVLTDFGEEAGQKLAGFDNNEHRWRRFLVEVRAVDEMLRQFAAAYERTPPPGAMSYPQLATDYLHDERAFKRLDAAARQAIKDKAERIAALGRELSALSPPFESLQKALPVSRSRLRSIARMED